MKRLGSMLMLTSIALSASAAVEDGKTYRIALAADTTKSLFLPNATKENRSQVVLWTETDVPAQQWTAVASDDGRFVFKNVYSGLYLNYVNKQLMQVSASNSPWTLEAVDEDRNIYYIKKVSYLHTDATEDGSTPTLGEAQEWQLIEVEPQSELNDYVRQRMADGFLRQYMQDKGTGYRTFVNGGWSESETQEAVLDMYEATGDPRYLDIYKACYSYFKYHVGTNWNGGTVVGGYGWYGYSFNDDVMWQIIGAARAYLLTGDRTFITDAKHNFDLIWDRAYLGYVGLLRWAEQDGDRNSANSCVNGPAAIAACYIAVGTGDSTYFAKARELYTNQRKHLYETNTGRVYDSAIFDPATATVKSRNTWASTYNQGTMLGAAILLHRHYGDEMYRGDANRIIAYAKNNLCNSDGIVKVCQNANGDFQGFKGILMRYAGLYVREYDAPTYVTWLKKNAMHAYCNMNSRGFGHSAWLTKAAENMMFGEVDYSGQAFGASTALSAAFAVRLGEAPTLLTTATDAVEKTADRLLFTYDAERKGRYELKVYYRTEENLTMHTTVNDGNRQTRIYDGTQKALNLKQLWVTLRQGTNEIEFTGTDGKMPEVEKIEISYLTEVSDVLEAEFARSAGAVQIGNDDLASNGRYAGFIGGGAANTLTFTYEAEKAGEYDLLITYFSGENRNMTVTIGDYTKRVGYAKTGSFSAENVAVKKLRVNLVTGTNTIVLSENAGWAPNVDKIELVRVPDESEGINSISSDEKGTARTGIYTLSGVRVTRPSQLQGILIVDGKKVPASKIELTEQE